eukprot:12810048-Alexandrium_andersonii.AAC.1
MPIFGVKGVNPYMVRAVVSALDLWGIKDVLIRTDQENSLLALAAEVRERRSSTTLILHAPRESHATMGS